MNDRFKIRLIAVALLALLLSACAATQPAQHPVVDRAQARWDALAAKDLETAYTYYTPGFRSAHSLIDFGVAERTKRVERTSAEYLDHECGEDRCTVRFNVGFRIRNAVPGMAVYDGKQVVQDTWIKTQGQWWYQPEK